MYQNLNLENLNLNYVHKESPFTSENLIKIHRLVQSFFRNLNSSVSTLSFYGTLDIKGRSVKILGSITKSKIELDIFLAVRKRIFLLTLASGIFIVDQKTGTKMDARHFTALFTKVLSAFSTGAVKFSLK